MTEHVRRVQALIVVDVQAGFVSGTGALPAAGPLLRTVGGLVERARAAGALIVHLQNDGPAGEPDEPHTPGWELALPVAAGPDEVVLRKEADDGFHDTPLGELLDRRGVRAVAIVGLMSEMCVSATARTALELGYAVVLPHDAHASYDIPAAPGISEAVPAPMVARVAEWALGDEVDIVPDSDAVVFTAPAP